MHACKNAYSEMHVLKCVSSREHIDKCIFNILEDSLCSEIVTPVRRNPSISSVQDFLRVGRS